MALGERVLLDLQRAMKRRDKVRVTTLRQLRAALQNREIAKQITLAEAEMMEVVRHAVKQCRETIAPVRTHVS